MRTARRALAPGGSLYVVDFGDLAGLPGVLARPLLRWLQLFRVDPVPVDRIARGATTLWHGPGRYYFIARLPPLAPSPRTPTV